MLTTFLFLIGAAIAGSDDNFADDQFCIAPVSDEFQQVPVGHIWTNPSANDPCSICECIKDREFKCSALKCVKVSECPSDSVHEGKCCSSCGTAAKSCVLGLDSNDSSQIFEHMSFVRYENCGEKCVCANGQVVCFNEFCWSWWIYRLTGLLAFFFLTFGFTVSMGHLLVFMLRRRNSQRCDCGQCGNCRECECSCGENGCANCAYRYGENFENAGVDPYYWPPNADMYTQKQDPAAEYYVDVKFDGAEAGEKTEEKKD